MPLTVHHLQFSQSERIPWLCEELGIPYTLVLHQRAPFFSPPSIRELSPLGQAPIIIDSPSSESQGRNSNGEEHITLFESAACVEYILNVYGKSSNSPQLNIKPHEKNYTDYLFYFHFSNGTFQPHILSLLTISRLDPSLTSAPAVRALERLATLLKFLDERLSTNEWLAGDRFTVADIMIVFSLTTMRCFYPLELGDYMGILGYLERVAGRRGYREAREKADSGMELMIDGKPPKSFAERLKEQGKL